MAARRAWVWGVGASAFLLAALLCGTAIGPVSLGFGSIVEAFASHIPLLGFKSHLTGTESAILWQLRLPRVVLAALVGAMLSAAGATYQGVFRNPLADPYLLGVASGAGLGATLAIVLGSSSTSDLLPVAAFAGGALAVAITFILGTSAGSSRGSAAFVLAGVTVTLFFTALQTFVQQQHASSLQTVYSWILGRLDTAGWHDVLLLLPYAGASLVALLLHRRLLDVLALGEDEAASLGIRVARVRLVLVAAATLGTAAAVAVSGLIGFLGVIVPHTVRLLAGSSYRRVVPLSILVGAGFLVFADLIARTAMSPAELPIGVVTAFFGAPFFAFVLRTRMIAS